MASTRSDENRGAGNDISADISQRLNRVHLDGSIPPNDSVPALACTGSKNEPRTAANMHGDSRVESNISNSQFTPGRDMISYNVSGNLTIHKYEESLIYSHSSMGLTFQQGTAIESDKNGPDTRGIQNEDDDGIATGMLMPAPPLCVLERDTQYNQIVAKLLTISNARVAILGMGGIGKTTLACSVANDPQIEEAYSRRLFLSFEGCSTPDLAYTNLASAFQTPVDRRSSHRQILSHILNYLKREKTLLVIDNFETFWEVPSNRRPAEELLAQLAALQKLALIVTLRGIQRPGDIRWVKIEPLQPLTQVASKELLSAIADEEFDEKIDSEYVQKLLKVVSGIPLAVKLIGSLLRDDCETPQSLWDRWTRESTKAIGIANDTEPEDRLYKLDVSLRLSIFGPRMSDTTKEALATFAILPTGLSMDDHWLNEFQDTLPPTINIRTCISALRNVALCILEPASSPPRLRLLPPIRDFCLKNMPLNGVITQRLIDVYNSGLLEHWDFGSGENYIWVTTELSNLSAMLDRAVALRYVTDELGEATYRYSEWRRFLCIPETDTIERAIDIFSEHSEAQAKCLQGLGSMLAHFNRAQEAIGHIERALSIHRELENQFQVGWDLFYLGDAYLRLNDDTNAERYLSEGRDLATEIDNKRNKGEILQALAGIYLDQKKPLQAESTAKEALELCRVSNDRRGEIGALWVLGRVYRGQGKYNLAVETLKAAGDVCQATHDTDSEASVNISLGHIYRAAKKPEQAALHFRLAVSLCEKAQDFKFADEARAILEELEISLDTSNDQ